MIFVFEGHYQVHDGSIVHIHSLNACTMPVATFRMSTVALPFVYGRNLADVVSEGKLDRYTSAFGIFSHSFGRCWNVCQYAAVASRPRARQHAFL